MATKYTAGDRIKLTADFLNSTGQLTGHEGASTWTVVDHNDCDLCARGGHVAVLRDPGEDVLRHLAVGNVQRVGERVVSRVPQGGFLRRHGRGL